MLFMLCLNLPGSCMLYRNPAAYLRRELIQLVDQYGSVYFLLKLIAINLSSNSSLGWRGGTRDACLKSLESEHHD